MLRHPPSSPLTTPAKPTSGGTSTAAAFPPPLGSSSPPISSPTSYRDHPSFTSEPSLSSSWSSRTHSSAGMFAARARASARSSSAAGSTGSGGTPRYGPRPGLRKATTGAGFMAVVDQPAAVAAPATATTTGYLLHRPLPLKHASERTIPRSIPNIPSSASAGTTSFLGGGDSLPGTMWKGKFRQRVLAVSHRKRNGKDRKRPSAGAGAGSGERDVGEGESASASDAEAEAEHEEIFRRMIQKEHRQRAHTMARSYDVHVGGSDPAVWEADVRDAERNGAVDDAADDDHGTPKRPVSFSSSAPQWQYRSAKRGDTLRSADADADAEDDDEDESQRELAQLLLEQEEEENARIEAYASEVLMGPPTLLPPHGSDVACAASVYTPGGVLGVEMEGFTWEDAPLSDDEGRDVEMT